MKTSEYLSIGIAMFLVGSVQSWAATIDFDFGSGVYTSDVAGWLYEERGFAFSTPGGNHFDSSPGGPFGPTGVPHLIFHESSANTVNNIITLVSSGGVFDFSSFDLTNTNPGQIPDFNPAMVVTASDGRTLTTERHFLGTVFAGWNDLTSITFDIIGTSNSVGNIVMDNVVIEPSPVPIPPAIWLFGSGLLALIGSSKRKETLE